MRYRITQDRPDKFWLERRDLFGWRRSVHDCYRTEEKALEALKLATSPRVIAEAEIPG